MSRILIIDDEPAIGWSLRELFTDAGHAVELAASVAAGLETCARFAPDAVSYTHLTLPTNREV